MIIKHRPVVAGIVLLLVCGHGYAGDSVSQSKSDDWSFQSKPDDWSYTVLVNDSLSKIKQKYLLGNAKLITLSNYNQLNNQHLLQPGQTLHIPLAMLKKLPVPVEVMLAEGDVSVVENVQLAAHKIVLPLSLQAGATLRAGNNSLIKLRFADGTITSIQPNSTVKIESSDQYAGKLTYVVRLKLSEGRTEIAANPQHQVGNHMEVETPSAVAVVRGTEFRVGAESTTMLEETLEGQVSFSAAGQSTEVQKDFGTVALNGQAPLPPVMLPEPPSTATFAKDFDALAISFALTSAVAGQSWVAQLANDEAFTKLLSTQEIPASASNSAKILTFENLAEGQYFLKLRAKDAHGLQSKDSVHAFNVHLKPLGLVLLQPLDAATFSAEAFEWQSMPNALGYYVQIAKDAEFNTLVFTRLVSYATFKYEKTLPAGDYFWRVAVKPRGNQGASAALQFSTPRKFSVM